MITRLILIRHGQTEWNLNKRYCGHTDIGLNLKGRRQAKKLRGRLKGERVDKIYTSDLKRAVESAMILFPRGKIQKKAGLREIHFGIFEGMTHKQILKNLGAPYKKWLKDPYKNHAPGGEKLSEFKKRVVKAFQNIVCSNLNKNIAVVCHGGVISVFITHILKRKNFWEHIPKSASVSVIEYKNGKPRVDLFNNMIYLG
ncbi:MAG: hypothetical protein COV72_00840 [Candidatus Omnitrophica bacterium CG11_big_fil_rev_8_21_14_0_20_42_13]|uniref:Alpha-ribazole phosphatase n=1 Tax=Candidatus Ghiorseimicrobium undicola TaxID=1974746 RepID=A0A2H0LZM1_9BACT|nr:MAG: hypothetical protein COV72_00840 [Candidatus Omnitrophica bacterium CG11_big_fil_rev_8_21_14_0_20_42_13]